jgi:hypothetical protein
VRARLRQARRLRWHGPVRQSRTQQVYMTNALFESASGSRDVWFGLIATELVRRIELSRRATSRHRA